MGLNIQWFEAMTTSLGNTLKSVEKLKKMLKQSQFPLKHWRNQNSQEEGLLVTVNMKIKYYYDNEQ